MKKAIENEIIEDYDTLQKKVDEYGTIKEIIKSKKKLIDILTYNGDRHLMLVFIEKLNKAIYNNELTSQDLELLRSNWLIMNVVNLKNLIIQKKRELFKFEKADKLKYLTLIKDTEFLIRSFWNQEFIDYLINNEKDSELYYWIKSGSIYMNMPFEIQQGIALIFIKKQKEKLGNYILKTSKEYYDRLNERDEKTKQ